MKAILKKNIKGIMLIFLASFLNATGQVFWKWGADEETKLPLESLQKSMNTSHFWYAILFVGIGFLLYGISSICVVFAFKMGKYNVLHPSLSVIYVFSTMYAYFIFGQIFTPIQIAGLFLIVLGVFFLGIFEGRLAKK